MVARYRECLAQAGNGPARAIPASRSARAALDLIPIFLAASIRALLAQGIALHASFASQLAAGTALAAAASNLPAAAAQHPAGTASGARQRHPAPATGLG